MTQKAFEEYCNFEKQLIQNRIKSKCYDSDDKTILDIINYLKNKEMDPPEILKLDSVIKLWDFQYVDPITKQLTGKSILDVIPISKYFINQEPKVVNKTVQLRSTTYYENKIPIGSPMIFVICQIEINDPTGIIKSWNLSAQYITDNELKTFSKEFTFSRWSAKIPIFEQHLETINESWKNYHKQTVIKV